MQPRRGAFELPLRPWLPHGTSQMVLEFLQGAHGDLFDLALNDVHLPNLLLRGGVLQAERESEGENRRDDDESPSASSIWPFSS